MHEGKGIESLRDINHIFLFPTTIIHGSTKQNSMKMLECWKESELSLPVVGWTVVPSVETIVEGIEVPIVVGADEGNVVK